VIIISEYIESNIQIDDITRHKSDPFFIDWVCEEYIRFVCVFNNPVSESHHKGYPGEY